MFQFEHKLLNVSISVHSVWSTLFWHTHSEYSLSMEYILNICILPTHSECYLTLKRLCSSLSISYSMRVFLNTQFG